MAEFLIDEDLPRSLAKALTDRRFKSIHVIDAGLRGRPDIEVFAYAVSHNFALITCDVGFADTRRFPLGSHHGILLARLSNTLPIETRKGIILSSISILDPRDILGNLVIIEPGRIRLRNKGSREEP